MLNKYRRCINQSWHFCVVQGLEMCLDGMVMERGGEGVMWAKERLG